MPQTLVETVPLTFVSGSSAHVHSPTEKTLPPLVTDMSAQAQAQTFKFWKAKNTKAAHRGSSQFQLPLRISSACTSV